MKNKKEELKFINYKKYILIIILLLICAVALNIMYRVSMVFATTYSNTVYKYIVRTFGALNGMISFSLYEKLIFAAILLFLFSLFRLIYLAIRYHKKDNRFKFLYRLKKTGLNLIVIILIVFNIYTLTCGINYNRIPFSVCNSMETEAHSAKDLINLCKILIDNANKYSEDIPLDNGGYFTLSEIDERAASVTAMNRLSVSYPCLSVHYPKPKAITASHLMSYTEIVGVYSPFTIEANYNNDIVDLQKPYTMCHELSHLSGFMLEDEANFISYLACINSPDIEFKYSGTVMTLIITMNQLYNYCGSKVYCELYDTLNEQVIKDIGHDSEYWKQFQSKSAKIVATASDNINNAYLKTNGLSDGVQSYGRVTDLLLTYYKDEL